ncbi:hypothetical protein [Pseudomonas zeae]|uniref:Uncharacterized protein n=1 Tax=Pseudomonas zeae TaxID=2745510 RepID=A0A9E6TAG7_9PSED|nr:hypothetical protein [Pseudomonas zeae]QXI10731.1 hypothetical protein HU754_023480 [Pseudomonas zeae]
MNAAFFNSTFQAIHRSSELVFLTGVTRFSCRYKKSHLANGWRGEEAADMTVKKDASEALEPPVITSPQNGDRPGARFVVKGTATPGSTVRAYSTKDSLSPLFNQAVGPGGDWSNLIDLRQFGFYVVEVAPNGEVSPRSPVVTIHLASELSAPHNDAVDS